MGKRTGKRRHEPRGKDERAERVGPGQQTASRVSTLKTKSIYAADMSGARPLSKELAGRAFANRRLITVGSVEATPHGTLRCERDGECLVVSLNQGAQRIGRSLIYRPENPAWLREGAEVPEAAFSVEIDEFVGTPWHEKEYTSVWTVHGLRTLGTMECCVDR